MGRTPQGVRGLKHDEGKLREDASRRTFQGVIFINEGWKGVNLG